MVSGNAGRLTSEQWGEIAWSYTLSPLAGDMLEAIAVAMNTLRQGLDVLYENSLIELIEIRGSPGID